MPVSPDLQGQPATLELTSPPPSAPVNSPLEPQTPASHLPTDYQTPAQKSTWQVQYTGAIETSLGVDVYNLDLFETDSSVIAGLHERNVFVMCYFSAGSYEDWRSDAANFPAELMGKDLEGWPGERWLDIRSLHQLQPIMNERLDQAVQKGCDGVDPDNLDGYINDAGFLLSYGDQLAYNVYLSESAHSRGLSIGLKNDLEQIPDLLPYFDWALNEQCFFYEECELLLPFVQAGKPVFNIEYELETKDFCPQARRMGFNSIRKNLDLDGYLEAC